MHTITYIIDPQYDHMKLEHFLRSVQGVSYRLVKKLKQFEDGIMLNGVHARTIDLLCAGDELRITMYDPPKEMSPCSLSAPILYEDEELIVFNKPAGVPCHQAKRHQDGTLAHIFDTHCKSRGEDRTFRCINRLDRNTTGAVVVAKNAYAANLLTGAAGKRYIALAGGLLPQDSGEITAGIARLNERSTIRIVSESGQYARTDYRVLGRAENYTAAECTLHTGRTHQIRVHFAHIGHPLLGDDLYGGDFTLIGRHALHCSEVWFAHPLTGQVLHITAPLPPDMQKLIELIPNCLLQFEKGIV